ncbi:MAG: hypothetical protein OXJ52_01565 [Oligoflexia bacterium]|nr:hypothetical protein [Oligoflexia bacterium]
MKPFSPEKQLISTYRKDPSQIINLSALISCAYADRVRSWKFCFEIPDLSFARAGFRGNDS